MVNDGHDKEYLTQLSESSWKTDIGPHQKSALCQSGNITFLVGFGHQ